MIQEAGSGSNQRACSKEVEIVSWYFCLQYHLLSKLRCAKLAVNEANGNGSNGTQLGGFTSLNRVNCNSRAS